MAHYVSKQIIKCQMVAYVWSTMWRPYNEVNFLQNYKRHPILWGSIVIDILTQLLHLYM